MHRTVDTATVPPRRHPSRAARTVLPLGAGVLATLIALAGAWIPSFWWDEAATISAADRTLPELGELLGKIDAVHGAYYALMHYWFDLVGISELTARLPSAVAIGVAAAALVQLARILAGTRFALVAGAVFMILPRTTWAGTEARSYAMVAAAAAVTGLVLVVALRSTRRLWWLLYALLMALSTVLFLYSAVLVAAHAVTVAVTPARRRWWFLVAAAGAGLLAAPFAVLAVSQSRQVGWVPPLDSTVVRTILVEQWFPGAVPFALCCLVLVVAGAIASAWRGDATTVAVSAVAVPWLLVPIAAFLGYSAFASNIYIGRYLIFTTPAVALLVALAVVLLLRSRVAVVVAVLALAAAALPAYVAQRQPWGKPGGMDYSTVADDVAARAAPGDCVTFQPSVSWQPTSLRSVEQARPDAFADLVDIGFGESAVDLVSLWDSDATPDQVAARARDCDVVWVVTDGERDDASEYLHPANVRWQFAPFHFVDSDLYRALAADGFVVSDRMPANHSQLVRLQQTAR
ncbi:glycosyltransferase family 39 protein [Rhodococcus gannanensis]|uniref:Mannosyltransferase n=1 Tax=Rhodococcus gannanensis TaxID=1960308 RepID=A0ABW4P0R3_9NOCA